MMFSNWAPRASSAWYSLILFDTLARSYSQGCHHGPKRYQTLSLFPRRCKKETRLIMVVAVSVNKSCLVFWKTVDATSGTFSIYAFPRNVVTGYISLLYFQRQSINSRPRRKRQSYTKDWPYLSSQRILSCYAIKDQLYTQKGIRDNGYTSPGSPSLPLAERIVNYDTANNDAIARMQRRSVQSVPQPVCTSILMTIEDKIHIYKGIPRIGVESRRFHVLMVIHKAARLWYSWMLSTVAYQLHT